MYLVRKKTSKQTNSIVNKLYSMFLIIYGLRLEFFYRYLTMSPLVIKKDLLYPNGINMPPFSRPPVLKEVDFYSVL